MWLDTPVPLTTLTVSNIGAISTWMGDRPSATLVAVVADRSSGLYINKVMMCMQLSMVILAHRDLLNNVGLFEKSRDIAHSPVKLS